MDTIDQLLQKLHECFFTIDRDGRLLYVALMDCYRDINIEVAEGLRVVLEDGRLLFPVTMSNNDIMWYDHAVWKTLRADNIPANVFKKLRSPEHFTVRSAMEDMARAVVAAGKR